MGSSAPPGAISPPATSACTSAWGRTVRPGFWRSHGRAARCSESKTSKPIRCSWYANPRADRPWRVWVKGWGRGGMARVGGGAGFFRHAGPGKWLEVIFLDQFERELARTRGSDDHGIVPAIVEVENQASRDRQISGPSGGLQLGADRSIQVREPGAVGHDHPRNRIGAAKVSNRADTRCRREG